jgi:hypothetical protein
MRAVLLTAAILLAPLGLPAEPAHACPAPSVPIYPGAIAPAGDGAGMPVTAGSSFVATDAPLLDIQAFYYTRMPNEGWQPVTQLPGQYADQFDGFDGPRGNQPLGVLEYSRNDNHEHVRIVADAGGYSVWVDCHD